MNFCPHCGTNLQAGAKARLGETRHRKDGIYRKTARGWEKLPEHGHHTTLTEDRLRRLRPDDARGLRKWENDARDMEKVGNHEGAQATRHAIQKRLRELGA